MEPFLIGLLVALFVGLAVWPWLREATAEVVAGVIILALGAGVKTVKCLAKAVSEVKRIGKEAIARVYTFIREKKQVYKTELSTSWEEVPLEVRDTIKEKGSFMYEYES